jgi:hypothetical protein
LLPGKVIAWSSNGTTGDGQQARNLAAGGVERHFLDVLLVDGLLEGSVFSLQGEAFRMRLNL